MSCSDCEAELRAMRDKWASERAHALSLEAIVKGQAELLEQLRAGRSGLPAPTDTSGASTPARQMMAERPQGSEPAARTVASSRGRKVTFPSTLTKVGKR